VGIRLEYDDKPVAGNPSGIVQVGDWLYITDYDSVNVYSVAIAALEDPSVADGGVVPVASYLIDDAYLPPLTVERHGVSLIALTDNSGTTPPDDGEEEDNSGTGDDETEDAAASAVTKLFALYNGAFEDGTHLPNSYVSAKVVRLGFDSNGNLVAEASVEVGMNTQSLTPVYDEERAVNLLVPAIGGIQQNGNTNGSNSTLHLVSGIFGTMAASIVFTGDGAPPTEETSGPAVSTSINSDIKSIGASDSAIVWLLLVTNDKNYLSWWRLFKTTVTDILGSNGKTLSEAIADGTLTPMDSGFGSPGYYWELLCESSVTDPGRLWFVMGTPVRISAMDNYNDRVLFDEGTLYKAVSGVFPDSVNIDSADLIGEMIYQYKLGNSIDTRLLKGQRPAAEDDDD
jgi:hypothetical protein